MRVLITLMPTHLSYFSLAPVAAFGIAKGVAQAGNIARQAWEGQAPSVDTWINNMFVFADLQANIITTGIERHLVKHAIPGREGYVLQDMGGKSTEISVSGKWIYENASHDGIEQLFGGFLNAFTNVGWNWIRIEMMKILARINIPLMLASDLFVGPVLIEKVDFKYIGGQPNVYEYNIKLVEWNPALSIAGTFAIAALQSVIGLSSGALSLLTGGKFKTGIEGFRRGN